MTLRIARIAGWSGLGVVLAVTAYLLINTTFMPYDDEGYVLISMRNYLAGLRLYDDVFSQYGPWPFVYHELVTRVLDTPLTHTLGRLLTIFHWVTCSLLCGVLGWRLTRSQLSAITSAILVFTLCWQNTSEPSHPGSHISLLVALAAVVVSTLPGSRKTGVSYAALGAITALLLLTKINVGLLLAASIGFFVLRHTSWPSAWQRAAGGLAAGGMLALPWVLMGRQLGLGWVLIFALQFTLAAAGLLWVTPTTERHATLPGRSWPAILLACGLAAGLVLGRVWLHGTGMQSLFEAILLNPMRMPAHFMVGLNWYAEVWLLTAVCTLVVLKAGHEIRRQGQLSSGTLWAVVVLRCCALVAAVLFANVWSTHAGIFRFSVYCLPLLPLFIVPLNGRDDPGLLARWGVAAVALPQVLHAFPVAGSQLAWATCLCVPLFVAGLFDLHAAFQRLLPTTGYRLAQGATGLLLVTSCYLLGLVAHTGWQRYVHSRPLDLPGAGDIRLDGKTRQAFRLLHLNASIHAELLFSRQGMFSHNIWSGIPTPTAQNATHWFWLLDPPKQQEIITRLESTSRSALITSQSLDEFVVKQNIPFGGPLQDFVHGHYRPLFRYGDFTFHVPQDSQAIAFGRYELLESVENSDTLLLRTHVRLQGQPVTIRLEGMEFPWENGPTLLTPRFRGVAEPIDAQGRTLGPSVPLPSARPLNGLYRLSVICPRLPSGLPWQEYLVAVRDAEGRLLSESIY